MGISESIPQSGVMRKQKISDKQKRFAQEYIIDSNATQAAIRAGYAVISAKVSGHNCITNYNVKREIVRLQDNLATKTGFTIVQAHKMYEEDRVFAQKCNQAGAAVSASTGICRLYGFDRDVNLNLNSDIPSDPVAYKSWLVKELARLEEGDEVIESYAKSKPAIAKRY